MLDRLKRQTLFSCPVYLLYYFVRDPSRANSLAVADPQVIQLLYGLFYTAALAFLHKQ